MAPQVRALAQSESKAKFMARLNLDDRNQDHKQIYHMMKVSVAPDRECTPIVERPAESVSRKKPAPGVTG
jgi:hypothetical protein